MWTICWKVVRTPAHPLEPEIAPIMALEPTRMALEAHPAAPGRRGAPRTHGAAGT